MKCLKSILMLCAFTSLEAIAGNERGGGVPPRPIFMPEDVSYECEISLRQAGGTVAGRERIISRVTQKFSWVKNEYGGRRFINLEGIKEWRHVSLKPVLPFGREAEFPIPAAPAWSKFKGFVSITVDDRINQVNDGDLSMKLFVDVTSHDVGQDKFITADGEQSFKLSFSEQVSARASLSVESSMGEKLDQRVLKAECKRIFN